MKINQKLLEELKKKGVNQDNLDSLVRKSMEFGKSKLPLRNISIRMS